MRHRRTWISKLLFVVTAFALLTGFGRCGHRHRHDISGEDAKEMAEDHVEDFIDHVDATEPQAQQLRAVAKPLIDDIPSLIEDHRATQSALRAEWASPNPDKEKVHQIIDERASELTKLVHRIADAVFEAHQILTPEQRQEIQEHWE